MKAWCLEGPDGSLVRGTISTSQEACWLESLCYLTGRFLRAWNAERDSYETVRKKAKSHGWKVVRVHVRKEVLRGR